MVLRFLRWLSLASPPNSDFLCKSGQLVLPFRAMFGVGYLATESVFW